jgi:hypothetical protein
LNRSCAEEFSNINAAFHISRFDAITAALKIGPSAQHKVHRLPGSPRERLIFTFLLLRLHCYLHAASSKTGVAMSKIMLLLARRVFVPSYVRADVKVAMTPSTA